MPGISLLRRQRVLSRGVNLLALRFSPRLSPTGKLCRLWLLSAVLVGLLPILAAIVNNIDHGRPIALHVILATGDALVLSAALAGGCVYDLINKTVDDDHIDTKNVLLVLAFLLGMGSAVWFVDIKNSGEENASNISIYTLLYLAGTVVVCLKALSLKDLRRVS
jgi:drug/metabolite transporter (DMT)-like permease